MAPEIFTEVLLNKKCDSYTFGIFALELLTG